MKKIFLSIFLLGIPSVNAHCPLCTIGAAAAAGGAAYLGVNATVIGIFIGAFAASMGLWLARMIKRQFVPFQKSILVILSFVTTVYPIKAMLSDYHPLYISWIGQYGTTLAIDMFLVGSILGGIILGVSPTISQKLTTMRDGKMIPYQGMILTFVTLILIGIIFQLVL